MGFYFVYVNSKKNCLAFVTLATIMQKVSEFVCLLFG